MKIAKHFMKPIPIQTLYTIIKMEKKHETI